jgi:hypothetical protein
MRNDAGVNDAARRAFDRGTVLSGVEPGDVWAHGNSWQGLDRKRWLLNRATARVAGFSTKYGQARRPPRPRAPEGAEGD